MLDCAVAQALDRRFLVPEGFKEREGELRGVERLLSQRRNGLFDLDGVHAHSPWHARLRHIGQYAQIADHHFWNLSAR